MNLRTRTSQPSSGRETEHKSDRVDETHEDVARQSTATVGASSMPERQNGAAHRKGRPAAAQGHRRASKRSKARRKERGLTFQRCWSNVRIRTIGRTKS
jgi:hypothetical protein